MSSRSGAGSRAPKRRLRRKVLGQERFPRIPSTLSWHCREAQLADTWRHRAAARCQATATSRCEMAPLPARGDPAPPENSHCHWSSAWPVSSPGAFPRPCAPAFKQSAGAGLLSRALGGLWPPVGVWGCHSAQLRTLLAVGWYPALSISVVGGGRVWCGRVVGPRLWWLWRTGGPGVSGGFRCSGRALLPSPALEAPREVHWITAASTPPAPRRRLRGWMWRRPSSPRAPGAAPGQSRSGCPGLVVALAAVHSRPAAFAPGAGEGPKERGQGWWSCTADAVWGKGVPQSLLWEGVHRDRSCVVSPHASSTVEFPWTAVGKKIL